MMRIYEKGKKDCPDRLIGRVGFEFEFKPKNLEARRYYFSVHRLKWSHR